MYIKKTKLKSYPQNFDQYAEKKPQNLYAPLLFLLHSCTVWEQY